jgi:hypothetical protein
MFALRIFRKHPWLTAIAVFSLSIAMAIGILGLSVSNTLLLLPPAAPDPDRLVTIHAHTADKDIDQISYPDYKYYRQNNRVFTDIAAAPNSVSLLTDSNFGGREARVMARPVSANYFDVLRVRPYLGRFFSPGDDEATPQTAVMTYLCWKRLGSDPHIAGRRFGAYTIIGVTPRSFTGSFYGLNGDLLTPLGESGGDMSWLQKREARRFFLIARLKPGVSRRQAQIEMAALSGQLARAYPKEDKNRTAIADRATLLPPDAIADAELGAGILMALTLLVLRQCCQSAARAGGGAASGGRYQAGAWRPARAADT